ncbi:MAG: family phage prohead protease [Microvirga sp.]|nr:family phage prohead protease [Microvirga sp.]
MNENIIVIRGYALQYNQTAYLSNTLLERVMPGAFRAQLADGRRAIRLQAYTHDPAEPALASTEDGTLTLFEDGYGLGWEALYEPYSHSQRWGIVRGMVSDAGLGCSVNFCRRVKCRRADGGAWLDSVALAEIDHICLCPDPAYPGTRAWRADVPLDNAPERVRQLAARWERGRARALAARPLPTARRFGSPPRFSPADMLRFAAVRAEAFRGPIARDGYIFAHTAFTRAAGFAG